MQSITLHEPAAPLPPSVEVQADGRITFRLAAPDANAVAVNIDRRSHPTTKDAAGLWSTTVGPLVPEIYEYSFSVDGARRVLDSRNQWTKPGEFAASLLEVPDTPPRFDQVQDVPHGAVELLTYRTAGRLSDRGFISTAMGSLDLLGRSVLRH